MSARLILASASAARADLLRAAGVKFRVVPSVLAEPPPDPGESLQHYLKRVAQVKAGAVSVKHPRTTILAADTAIWLPGKRNRQMCLQLIGKPRGRTQAACAAAATKMLQDIAGREHVIGTGVCVLGPADAAGRREMRCGYSVARVRLRDLTIEEIRRYVARVKPWHCAGAYALQGGGAAIIAEVRGDPTTIIGLPVDLTLRMLAKVTERN